VCSKCKCCTCARDKRLRFVDISQKGFEANTAEIRKGEAPIANTPTIHEDAEEHSPTPFQTISCNALLLSCGLWAVAGQRTCLCSKLVQAVALLIRTPEVLIRNLIWSPVILTQVFVVFSVPSGTSLYSTSIEALPLHFTPFSIHYSLVIQPFDGMQSELLTA
jgi:hypothetical protein